MQQPEDRSFEQGRLARFSLPLALGLLAGISAYCVISLAQERRHSQDLALANQQLSASLQQVRSEVRAVSDKLNTLASPTPPAAATAAPLAAVSRPKVRVAPVRTTARKTPDDPRWHQIQARVDGQQKELSDTKQQLDQTRQDLQDKVNSTRDELGGSIAKNHDELVALQKRGERSYFEFAVVKSKQFQRVGPLSVSVRKVNLKHKYFDLVLTVDDQQIEKKQVSLYEPVMLTLADRPQPVELVANEINNDQVKGYVSDAKYKKSELASAPSAPAPAESKELQRR
jgi:hypothetical protein